jgi:hypothetical protein
MAVFFCTYKLRLAVVEIKKNKIRRYVNEDRRPKMFCHCKIIECKTCHKRTGFLSEKRSIESVLMRMMRTMVYSD